MSEAPLWSWDLETEQWDRPLCAVATSTAGDVERFEGPSCIRDVGRLMAKTGGQWLAHSGGTFDVPLLMNETEPRFQRLILTGSRILCAEGPKRLRARDTYPATLASLAKIGKWVGREKGDVDRTRLEELTMREVVDYCENDCRVLLDGIGAMRAYLDEQGARRAWTAGAAAVNLLQALEPGSWSLLRRHAVGGELAVEALDAVRGGRIESWARGRVEGVWSYDIRSSYPTRYAHSAVGVGVRRSTEADLEGVFRCRWYWPHRDKIPPATDELTGAGAGWCEAWLVREEVEQFRRCGVEVEKLHGWAPVTTGAVGQSFAAELFAQKEAGSPWSKVFLNSLHGKFSQHPVREQWTRDHPEEWWAFGGEPRQVGPRGNQWWRWQEFSVDAHGNCPAHVQPIAAAQVLGRARAALWEILHAVEDRGWHVLYCDTDCIHTTCPPEAMPVPVGGDELGALAVEIEHACVGWYLGPKAYLLTDGAGRPVKSALKGVPLGAMRDGIKVPGSAWSAEGALYREARQGERGSDLRLDLFREALDSPWGAVALKEGIDTFVGGLDQGGRWKRSELRRTVRPCGRGKTWGPTPTAWAYQMPAEVNPDLAQIEQLQLTENDFPF